MLGSGLLWSWAIFFLSTQSTLPPSRMLRRSGLEEVETSDLFPLRFPSVSMTRADLGVRVTRLRGSETESRMCYCSPFPRIHPILKVFYLFFIEV